MRISATICLVPEARGGPFLFWNDLAAGCEKAAALGFHGVEVFPPSGRVLAESSLGERLTAHGLGLAAVGTGAGWVLHRLQLTHPDPLLRRQAREFIAEIIEVAAAHGAPAVVGSMQGRAMEGISRQQALIWLGESLEELGERAGAHRLPLLYEPLNRYETNLINSLAEAVAFVQSLKTRSIRLLADLFHMNIEEESIPQALRAAAGHVGHLHFVDSNRRPAGNGHLDFRPIADTLAAIGYQGYASAEALPYPDSEQAARQTMATFRRFFA